MSNHDFDSLKKFFKRQMKAITCGLYLLTIVVLAEKENEKANRTIVAAQKWHLTEKMCPGVNDSTLTYVHVSGDERPPHVCKRITSLGN